MTDRVINAGGLTLDLGDPSAPLTRRLMTALRDGIRDGRLQAGLALPPSRALASDLGCSRWVVTEAYGQLVSKGYLVATTGSATRVVGNLGAVGSNAKDRRPQLPRRARFDLAAGVPDLAAFPRSRWADAYRRAVQHRQTELLATPTLMSTIEARTVVTDYLRRARHVQEEPTQLSMSTGATAGTGWLARLLAAIGHRKIAVEDPSWPGLRDAARFVGLELVPINVDAEGLCVDELYQHQGVRLVITTPAHQFPTGVAMSPARRLELIAWAEQVNGVIIEDDYDAEFRYDRRPVASLQGMAPERVALVGSVSKSLSPAIGLGWVVMPQWLIDHIVTDDLDRIVGPSVFAVEAFATMISNGWYERHLRAMRTRYRHRRAALVQAIETLLPGCRLSGMEAGMHLMLHLPGGVDAPTVVDRARDRDVGVTDLDRYRLLAGAPTTLVIGFGNLRTGREGDAIAQLAAAIADSRQQ